MFPSKSLILRILSLTVLACCILWLTNCGPDATEPELANEPAPDKAMPIITFVVHGDTHSGYDTRNPDVPAVHAAFSQAFTNLDPDYIFHTGDVVDILSPLANPYTMAHDTYWDSLVDDHYFVARGNHDDPDSLLAYLPNQSSLNHTVVDATAKSLFIILDVPQCGANLTAQYNYLVAQLTDPAHDALTHRFVFFHASPYSFNSKVGDCPTAQTWDSVMAQNGVDIVFSGHSHAYEHYRGSCPEIAMPGFPDPPMSAIHYVVTGRSGGYEHTPDPDFDCDDCSNCIEMNYTHNYVYVAVGVRDRISVNVRDHNGWVLDYFQIVD